MYRYLFGPVPSRRLGMSLGVDLVPRKVCSLDCIYCEVGKTTALTVERKEYIPAEKLKTELEDFFEHQPDPDYFTFSGSGEPTLNSGIGRVIEWIKERKPHIPIAVLTNGTLLSDPQVRKEISQASLILPSIDAATQTVMNRINRPVKGLTVQEHINGLEAFRNEFKGTIWLEVMIIPGYNDHPDELKALKSAIQKIRPDKIQLNSLDRPGAVDNIRAATQIELEQIITFWNLDHVEIISKAQSRKSNQAYQKDIEGSIVETISRRPCTLDDLSHVLGLHVSEINKYLDSLEKEGTIRAVWQNRGLFYQLADR